MDVTMTDKRRITVRDIARAANVSVSTVSMTLNGRPGISPALRELVWETASKLGYVGERLPNHGKPQAVGLLVEKSSLPLVLDPFYSDVIRGLQSEAQRLGIQVILNVFDPGEDLNALEARLSEQVQGVAIASDRDVSPDMLAVLERMGLPFVLIDTYVPGRDFQCVSGDNFTAGYRVMQHLLELGHRSIAILPGPDEYSNLVDRVRGALAATAEARVTIQEAWMPRPQTLHPREGHLQMQRVLQHSERPTAVFAASDRIAIEAIQAINDANLRIPSDLAVAGVDDIADSATASPPLTTYRIPRYEMGMLAMRKLEFQITSDPGLPTKIMPYGGLIVRGSTVTRPEGG